MKFGILVNEGPYTHQAADTAYNFCKSALEAGHEIFRVFFYHDGVNNPTRYTAASWMKTRPSARVKMATISPRAFASLASAS